MPGVGSRGPDRAPWLGAEAGCAGSRACRNAHSVSTRRLEPGAAGQPSPTRCSRAGANLPARPLLTPAPPRLQEYTNKLAAVQGKGDDYEVAAAQIGVEVYAAMNAAIGG